MTVPTTEIPVSSIDRVMYDRIGPHLAITGDGQLHLCAITEDPDTMLNLAVKKGLLVDNRTPRQDRLS